MTASMSDSSTVVHPAQTVTRARESRLVALSGLVSRIGELVPVTELLDSGVPIEQVNELLEYGVQTYSKLPIPLEDCIRDCVYRALMRANLTGGDVDCVFVLTESFERMFGAHDVERSFRETRDQLLEALFDLGIRKSSINCMTFGGCVNVLHAMLAAKALLTDGCCSNVLIVCAEGFADARTRQMKEAVSIAGDGVAACIVSSRMPAEGGGYWVEFANVIPYMTRQADSDVARTVLDMVQSVRSAASACYRASGRQSSDYRWVVFGDYNRRTTIAYSRLLGIPVERTFLENSGRMGHVPCDALVNLGALLDSKLVGHGDSVLALVCGRNACGTISLTVP